MKKPKAAVSQTVPANVVIPSTQSAVKLFLATPMYNGDAKGFYLQGLIGLQQVLPKYGVGITTSMIFNESLITRGRNALSKGFMQSDSTHLMFIDSDIRFDPQHVVGMIAADVDVICGIYPKKEINWQSVHAAVLRGVEPKDLHKHSGSFVVNLVNYQASATVASDKPFEIYNGGTGFMLIKRHVLEKMKNHVETYINDVVDALGNGERDPITEYFFTCIEPGTRRLLSEDFAFCAKWREMGGKIHAAPWVKLAHCGSYLFDGELLETTEPCTTSTDSLSSHPLPSSPGKTRSKKRKPASPRSPKNLKAKGKHPIRQRLS